MKSKSKYNTEVMKDSECLLFVETALESGLDVNNALQDMRMIDNLLSVKRNHLIAFGHIKRTQAGFLRKGTSLYSAFENVVNARADGIEM